MINLIEIVNGDLLVAKEDIIGHQVNCQGVMGSGIAKSIREKYPRVYESYKYLHSKSNPNDLLGHCQLVKIGDIYVANLFGQLNYGREKVRYTDYHALNTALTTLKNFAKANEMSVALPFNIGCGLANGDWNIVKKMIDGVFEDHKVTLYKILSW